MDQEKKRIKTEATPENENENDTDSYSDINKKLMCASAYGLPEEIKDLLNHRANQSHLNSSFHSDCLMKAVISENYLTAQILLREGANPNQPRPFDYETPLNLASKRSFPRLVKLLLDHNADPNQCNLSDGYFPLLSACLNVEYETAEILLKHGANPNQIMNPKYDERQTGEFPLYIAAYNGSYKLVQLLLKYGSNPNQLNQIRKLLPLSTAIELNHFMSVRYLLKYGANPNLGGETWFSPLRVAIENENMNMIKLLLTPQLQARETLLLCCAREYQEDSFFHDDYLCRDMFREILKFVVSEPDVNYVEPRDKEFPLATVSLRGSVEITKFLLENGANPNQPFRSKSLLDTISGRRRSRDADEIVKLLQNAITKQEKEKEKEHK